MLPNGPRAYLFPGDETLYKQPTKNIPRTHRTQEEPKNLPKQHCHYHDKASRNPRKANRFGGKDFPRYIPVCCAARELGAKVPSRTRMNRWSSTVRKCRTIPNQHLGDRCWSPKDPGGSSWKIVEEWNRLVY